MFTIELTENEMQALAGLLDAGVRSVGLRGVKDATNILQKLEEAANKEISVDEKEGE